MSELSDKLVSPHGFDGFGEVPPLVIDATREIARLRVKYLISILEPVEVGVLFDDSAVVAEWLREVADARDWLKEKVTVLEDELARVRSRLLRSWEATYGEQPDVV